MGDFGAPACSLQQGESYRADFLVGCFHIQELARLLKGICRPHISAARAFAAVHR